MGCSVWPAGCGIADFVVFCEFMEGGRRVWGPPGCMWIWKMRLSGCRKNIAVTSTLLNTSKNPVDFENSYSLHVQLEAMSHVTAIFFEDSGLSYCRTTVAINWQTACLRLDMPARPVAIHIYHVWPTCQYNSHNSAHKVTALQLCLFAKDEADKNKDTFPF